MKRGYKVELAENGTQAALQTLKQRPDFLLLDQTMPGMTGTEVVRILKESGVHPLLYTLLLTGLDSEEDQKQALLAGVDCFLPKPCDLLDLLAKLTQGEAEIKRRSSGVIAKGSEVFQADFLNTCLAFFEGLPADSLDIETSLLLFEFGPVGDTSLEARVIDEVGRQCGAVLKKVVGPQSMVFDLSSHRFAVLSFGAAPDQMRQAGLELLKSSALSEFCDQEDLQVHAGGAMCRQERHSALEQATAALTQAIGESPQLGLVFN